METETKKPYGMELILDLHDCDLEEIITKEKLTEFFDEVCRITKMKKHGTPKWWTQKSKNPFLHGTSAIQFVVTSDIVCHILPKMHRAYINIFTCKLFEPNEVIKYAKEYWRAGTVATAQVITRK